jgi:hypothetical protein
MFQAPFAILTKANECISIVASTEWKGNGNSKIRSFPI